MIVVDDLILKTAPLDTPRNTHYEYDRASGMYVRTLLLEGAKTNLIAQPEAFDDAAWFPRNLVITPDTIPAPLEGRLACTFTDNSTDAAHDLYDFITLPMGVAAGYTFYAKHGSGIFPVITIYTATGILTAIFNTTTGTVDQFADTGTAAFVVDPWMEPLAGGWYRCNVWGSVPEADPLVLLSSAPAASGNTLGATGEVAYIGTGKTMHIFGCNAATGSPTSYMPGAFRIADSLTFPIDFGPRALTAYVRGIERGTIAHNSSGHFTLGSDAYQSELVSTLATDGAYFAAHFNGSFPESGISPGPEIGDAVELRVFLAEDGSVQLGQSINGAAEVVQVASAALAFDADWDARLLRINKAAEDGYFAFRDIIIAREERDMEWFRRVVG